MSDPNKTLLLGFEVAFSLPDWFPPEAENYTYLKRYPKGHAYYPQVEESIEKNYALDALYKLPDLDTTAVSQLCGNWVSFKFQGIGPSKVALKTEQCRQSLNAFLLQWVKPIMGHEYVVQRNLKMYEVLDLTEDTVVWVDATPEACQKWIDQTPAGHYWVEATAISSGHKSRVGPFPSQQAAWTWMDENRPEVEWKDVDVVSDAGDQA